MRCTVIFFNLQLMTYSIKQCCPPLWRGCCVILLLAAGFLGSCGGNAACNEANPAISLQTLQGNWEVYGAPTRSMEETDVLPPLQPGDKLQITDKEAVWLIKEKLVVAHTLRTGPNGELHFQHDRPPFDHRYCATLIQEEGEPANLILYGLHHGLTIKLRSFKGKINF